MPVPRSGKLIAAAVLVSSALGACSEPGTSPRGFWESGNYRVDERLVCFCAPPHEWTAIVRDGEVVDVIVSPVQGFDPETLRAEALRMAWTVEEALEIAHEVEQNADSYVASSVRYNRDLGYPEAIYVDPSEHPDDELGREMSNLEPLIVK